MLSSEEINTIGKSVNIVDIISNYIPLTKRGKNYFGVCPFHPDSDPSFCVSESKQIYMCFSCKNSGNVFNFIMNYENVPFSEALKIIAAKAGISVKTNSNLDYKEKNTILYEIYDLACHLYQNNINTEKGEGAKKYLKERGFDDNIISDFMIGLSLKHGNLLSHMLQNKKISNEEILKSGLVSHSSNEYRDVYVNRIMFPIWNINGKVVGFSGRIFNGEDTTQYAKYINSKENPIFKKGELLYNYHRAKTTCRQKNTVIIVEGQLDLIRVYSIGITNIVATMGTAFTPNHANLVKKLARSAIIMFDGDSAGEKATYACGNELKKVGVQVKVVRLEDNLDPDEYIKKYGKERFEMKINSPINFMDFKLSFYKNNLDLNDSNDIAKYVNNILLELSSIDDEILREVTLKKLSIESKLDIDFLRDNLEKKLNTNKKNPIKEFKQEVKKDKYEIATKNLIYYMLKDKNVIKIYNESKIFIPNEMYRLLAKEISGFYLNNGFINVSDVMNSFINDKEMLNLIGEIESIDLKEKYDENEIYDYINVIKQYNINSEKSKLNEKMVKSNDESEKLKLAQELFEMKKSQMMNRSE